MSSETKRRIAVFFLFFVSYSYFFHIGPADNPRSREDLMRAVVEQGVLHIDAYHENTIDKAFHSGHYYSDKAIGAALLGLPVVALAKWLSPGQQLTDVSLATSYYLATVFAVSLPSALLGLVLFSFLGALTDNHRWRLWVTLGYGLGTLAFPYSQLFYGHQIAAALCFFVFVWTFNIRGHFKSPPHPPPSPARGEGTLINRPIFPLPGRERAGVRVTCPKDKSLEIASRQQGDNLPRLVVIGLAAGYAFITEYPAFVILSGCFIYLLFSLRNKKLIWIPIAVAIPVVSLQLAYNHVCYGGPFSFGYQHEHWQAFREGMSRGFMGVTYPKLIAIYGITFSPYRGLFFLSPFLLLAIPGFYHFHQRKDLRFEFWLSLGVVGIFFLLTSSYYLWWGGATIGPRFMIPMLPFMAFPIIFLPGRWRPLAMVLAAISIVLISIATLGGDPQVPEHIKFPWVTFLPNWARGTLAFNAGGLIGLRGYQGLLPYLLCVIVSIWGYLAASPKRNRSGGNHLARNLS